MRLIILTLCFTLTVSSKRHVPNSVEPFYPEPPVYDISNWVNKLHLQRCAIVEIGQGHCALFVESVSFKRRSMESPPVVREYFLGICEMEVIMKWRLCSTILENLRPNDCTFNNETITDGVRVHRRLCDISNLAYYGEPCRCDMILANRTMYKVDGFPTCFQTPLPDSICSPLNVCGLQGCSASTAVGKIHTAECNPSCLGKQPFCELSGSQTGHLPEISSFWTDWSDPLCSEPGCSTGMLYMEATCVNSINGGGAVDCLGPGTSCCPRDVLKCKCNTYMENGILKVFRTYVNPPRTYSEKRSVRHFRRCIKDNPDELFLRRLYDIMNATRKELTRAEREDYEDDDESDDTNGEDIAIEENMDKEISSSTIENLEKSEIKMKMLQDEVTDRSSNASLLGDEDAESAGTKSQQVNNYSIRSVTIQVKLLLLTFAWICMQ